MSSTTTPGLGIRMRKPTLADGARLHAFVEDSALETNSRYAYLLLATHFRDTCLLAERGDELAGFVVGYRVPGQRDTLFVWQIGVAPSERRAGLGLSMLVALIGRLGAGGIRCVEATVASSNAASRRLFESLARARDTTCARLRGFAASDFGNEDHEDEVLLRVGPWETPS